MRSNGLTEILSLVMGLVLALGWAPLAFSDGSPTLPPINQLTPVPPSLFQATAPATDANADSVGAIAAQYQVDPTGAATYSVPLHVPTGSANMQPALALNYSSRGANGSLGVGWGISGLSAIARCKKGAEFGDGAGPFGQPNLDSDASNDAYCLDGARLLAHGGAGTCPVHGAAAGTQAFGLELDTTTLVCGYTASGITDFSYWLVLPADGSIRRYGAAGASALPWNSNGVAVTTGYLSWSLDRQADRSGNTIDFSYALDAAHGEQEIAEIDYTGQVDVSQLPTMGAFTRSPFASVVFTYETMPAAGQRVDYLAGMQLRLSKRLASITVNGPSNYPNASVSTVVHTYHLGYQDSATSGLSTLVVLKECAPNGSAEVCYPATTFSWNSAQAPGFTNESSATALNSPFAYSINFKVGNISGNGTQSVVFLEDRACGPAYSGARFRLHATYTSGGQLYDTNTPIDVLLSPSTRPTIPTGCTDPTAAHLENTYALYDIDGDGRDDLIVLTPTQGWVAYLSSGIPGLGFSTTATPLGIAGPPTEDGKLVDVFGDGLPALVHGLGTTFNARHLQRVATLKTPQPAYQFASSDVPLQFATPTDLPSGVTVTSVGINSSNARVLAAGDIDGNGAADLIMRVLLSNQAKRWYVYRNTGLQGGVLQFAVDEDLQPNDSPVISDDGNDVQFVDFGGNGQAGVMYQVPVTVANVPSQAIHYRLNIGKADESAAGSRFGPDSGAVLTLPTARAKRVQVLDINQDHKPDLVYYDNVAGAWPLEANLFGSTGFGPTVQLCSVSCNNTVNADNVLTLFLDSNGDGEVAMFRFQGLNGFWSGSNTLFGVLPDSLAKVTSGFGASTQFTYAPLTNPSVYVRSTDGPQQSWGRGAPVFDVFGAFWVVAATQSDAPTDDASAGSASASTTSAMVSYTYASARMQSGGRGFLGFGQVSSTDVQASATQNVQTRTRYRQDFPFIGRPQETQVYTIPPVPMDPCLANPNLPKCQTCKPICNAVSALDTATTILMTDSDDTWSSAPAFVAGPSAIVQSLAIYRQDSNEQHFDATTGDFSHGSETQLTIDAYGNALTTTVVTNHADASTTPATMVTDETLTTANIYGCSSTATSPPTATCTPSTIELQRLGRLSVSAVTSKRGGTSTTRRVSFEYDPTTYQLYSEIQGPYSTSEESTVAQAALIMRTDYVLDGAGNRTETHQCSGVDFPNRSACLSLSGFVQQQYASATKFQRYSKTLWEPLDRFTFGATVPFYSATNTAGNEHYSQLAGVNPDGHGGYWVYRDKFGNPVNALDANDIQTGFTYGLMGRKTFQTDSTGAFRTFGYMWCSDAVAPAGDIPPTAPRANCPAGAVYRMDTTAVDAGASLSIIPATYSYFDRLGRAVLKTTRVYQSTGTLSHWASVATVYDTDGRTIKTTVPYFSVDPTVTQAAATTRAGYPEAGISPLPAAETASYDAISRPLDESHPEQSTNGTSDTVMQYQRTSTTLTNPRTFTSTTVQNGRAETIAFTDQASGVVGYTRGTFGNTTLVQVTPVVGAAPTTYQFFDRLGRKTAITDPDKGAWTYTYNALGEQITQTDAKKQVQTLQRDALGRVIQRINRRADGTTEQISSWTYDTTTLPPPTRFGLGLIASESSSLDGYTRTTSYDIYARPASISTTLDGTTYVENQTYDVYGRALAHTDATATNSSAGETVGYSTDGFAITLTDGVSGLGSTLDEILAMSPRGQTSMERYGGSAAMQTTRTFDPVTGRLTHLTSGTNGALQNWTYTYDKHTNLTSRWNQATGYDQRETFTYDSLDRLTNQTLDRLNGVVMNTAVTTLAYDGLGNITTKNGIAYTYATQPSGCSTPAGVHAVSAIGASQRYCYDANGNQTTATGPTTRAIAYTSYDLPASIQQTTPTATEIDFTYAPDRALWKRSDGVVPAVPGTGPGCAASSDRIFCNGFEAGSTAGVAGSGGTPTYYVGNVEIIGSGSSATIKRYVGAFLIVTTPPGASDVYTYLFKDSIGSIDVITTASGTVMQRHSFDPHGQRRETSPGNPAWQLLTAAEISADDSITRLSFTGHWGLDAVGLIHMKGRLYDPALGRFIQADPFTERDASQGLNRYTYVLNNPLSMTDPTGYLSLGQWIGIGIGIVAGIASGGLFAAGAYWASFGVAVAGGFVSAWVASGFNANAGLWGAFAAGVFWGIGAGFQQISNGNTGAEPLVGGTKLTYGQFEAKVALQGVAGGVLGKLQGGNFGNGFWSAGATAALSPEIDALSDGTISRAAASALVGGTVSAATGGKFANGAETGFFQAAMLGASEMGQQQSPSASIVGTTGSGFAGDPYYIPDFSAPIVKVAFSGVATPELAAQIFSAAAGYYESVGVSVQFEQVAVGTKNSLLVDVGVGTPLLNPSDMRAVTVLGISFFGRSSVNDIWLNSSAVSPNYVFTHELGHAFGLADRYDLDTFETNPGFGNNLMGKYNGNSIYQNQINTINANLSGGWQTKQRAVDGGL